MPLVTCPDCGRDVSTRAKACPNCGCPSEFFPKAPEPEEPKPAEAVAAPPEPAAPEPAQAPSRDVPGKPRRDFVNAMMHGFEEPRKPVPTIPFGAYDGAAIEWRTLAEEDGKTLLLSERAIDCRPFHGAREDTSWSACDLRAWLNGEFLAAAFSDDECAKICETVVSNPANPNYGTDGGPDATDKLFCLSVDEVRTYFEDDEARVCVPTSLAKSNGAVTNGSGACSWWLRTPGDEPRDAALVTSDGSVYLVGTVVANGHYAVRPAMWVEL